MNIGKVVGSVVCTVKTSSLTGIKLLVVRQIVNGHEKGLIIASDGTRQAGIGDYVYMIGRKEAALILSREDPPPSDITIAGIIDPETLWPEILEGAREAAENKTGAKTGRKTRTRKK